jgi:hypothetical protein
MRECYVDFAFANNDLFDDGLDDPALVFDRELRPPGIKSLGFGNHFLRRYGVYLQMVDLCFQLRKAR